MSDTGQSSEQVTAASTVGAQFNRDKLIRYSLFFIVMGLYTLPLVGVVYFHKILFLGYTTRYSATYGPCEFECVPIIKPVSWPERCCERWRSASRCQRRSSCL